MQRINSDQLLITYSQHLTVELQINGTKRHLWSVYNLLDESENVFFRGLFPSVTEAADNCCRVVAPPTPVCRGWRLIWGCARRYVVIFLFLWNIPGWAWSVDRSRCRSGTLEDCSNFWWIILCGWRYDWCFVADVTIDGISCGLRVNLRQESTGVWSAIKSSTLKVESNTTSTLSTRRYRMFCSDRHPVMHGRFFS